MGSLFSLSAFGRFLSCSICVPLVVACNPSPSDSGKDTVEPSLSTTSEPTAELIPTTGNSELRRYIQGLADDVSSNADDSDTWGRVCMAFDANGLDEAAERCYTVSTERFPNDTRWHYLLAVRLHKNGDLANALTAIQTAIKLNPDQPAALMRLGNWQIESGQFKQANSAFARAKEKGAGPAAELGLAQSLLKLGDNQDALELLLDISKRTDHPVAMRTLGQAWRAIGNEANARRYLATATDAKGMWFDDPQIRSMQSYAKTTGKRLHEVQLSLNAGLFKEALDTLDDLAGNGEADFNVHYHYALTYFQIQRFEDARVHLKEALALEPVHFPSHLLMAALYQQADENRNALEHLQTVTQIFPALQVAHQELGFVQLRLSDVDGALASFKKAIDLDSTAPNVHYYAGVILGERGACHEALTHFENTLRLDPSHTKAALGKQTCEQDAQRAESNPDLITDHQTTQPATR